MTTRLPPTPSLCTGRHACSGATHSFAPSGAWRPAHLPAAAAVLGAPLGPSACAHPPPPTAPPNCRRPHWRQRRPGRGCRGVQSRATTWIVDRLELGGAWARHRGLRDLPGWCQQVEQRTQPRCRAVKQQGVHACQAPTQHGVHAGKPGHGLTCPVPPPGMFTQCFLPYML